MYLLVRKTCMRCLFCWLGKAWLFVQPTLQHFSSLPFDAAPWGIIFAFSFVSFHLWHRCYNPRGTRTNLDRPPFSTTPKSSGLRMVQTPLFFVCLTVVNMFLLGLSLAGHALQPMCALFLALAISMISMRISEVFSNLMDSVTTLQVIYVLSTFSTVHESFFSSISPSFPHHCVVCWADHLIHPTTQPLW